MSLKDVKRAAISGNQLDCASVPARLEDVERVGIVDNVLNGTGKATVAGKNRALVIRSNIGLDDSP
jgi:hypothetical protein